MKPGEKLPPAFYSLQSSYAVILFTVTVRKDEAIREQLSFVPPIVHGVAGQRKELYAVYLHT
jgi:hypothetical protein